MRPADSPAHQPGLRGVQIQSLVFVAPPWREINANDAERRQDWDEAVRTHAVMVDTYRVLGYETMELPRTDVAERVSLVLDVL